MHRSHRTQWEALWPICGNIHDALQSIVGLDGDLCRPPSRALFLDTTRKLRPDGCKYATPICLSGPKAEMRIDEQFFLYARTNCRLLYLPLLTLLKECGKEAVMPCR